MGVQHLWNILEPSKRAEPIENLRGKTLCIDLSLWMCEAQGTKGLKDQLKPYLRNIFFRTMYLTSIGVRPVFVVDGNAPEVKRETILKRLQARSGQSGKQKNLSDKQRKLRRSKFKLWGNECCEMLGLLGIPYVKSEGEAEAMCAWLNVNKVPVCFTYVAADVTWTVCAGIILLLKWYADGILTDDGDVFLYGAKVVYKDFNISSSKLLTDSLPVYNVTDIESHLGLNQRNMIALALLLGCDYLPSGVPGIGKETAVRLLNNLLGVDLLGRFLEWKASPGVHPENYTNLEVSVKRKAVQIPDFPNKAVISEFLSPKIGSKNIRVNWTCPDLEGIKEFLFRKLEWPRDYTEEKMLNLVTDWQLTFFESTVAPLFVPVRIVKKRMKQKVQYYDIEWKTQDIHSKWPLTFVSTKSKEVMHEKHSELVESFESEIMTKKCKSKTKKKDKKIKAPSCINVAKQRVDLASKTDNVNLKEKPAAFDSGQDSTIVTHVQENPKDAEEPSNLSTCMSVSKTLLRSNKSNDFPKGGTCLKFGSPPPSLLRRNATVVHEYPYLPEIHEPITGGLENNPTRIDFEELTSLHGVSKTKNLSNADNNEELDGGTNDVIFPLTKERLRVTGEVCTNLSVRRTFAYGNSLLADGALSEFSQCLDSSSINDNTVLNLVDITIDQSCLSDPGGIEDLLASSFVAKLKDVTVEDQLSMGKAQVDTQSSSCTTSHCCSFIPTEIVSFNHEDDSFLESFGGLNLESVEHHKQRANGNCKDVLKDDGKLGGCRNGRQLANCISESCTSKRTEESPLTSRLLKRFQWEDGGIAKTLRSISAAGGDERKHEHGYRKENSIATSCFTKKNESCVRCKVVTTNTRPLEDVTNQRKNGRNIDIIVLD